MIAKTYRRSQTRYMKRKAFFSSIVCGLMLASLSIVARSQDAPYRLNDKQVQRVMKQLKKDSERFRKSLDSSLDKSRLNGTNREDDINRFVHDYEKATERLYDHFKDNKSAGGDVEAVLDGAARDLSRPRRSGRRPASPHDR